MTEKRKYFELIWFIRNTQMLKDFGVWILKLPEDQMTIISLDEMLDQI